MNMSVAALRPGDHRELEPLEEREGLFSAPGLSHMASRFEGQKVVTLPLCFFLCLAPFFTVLYAHRPPMSPVFSFSFSSSSKPFCFTSLLPSLTGASFLGSTAHHDRLILWMKEASLV